MNPSRCHRPLVLSRDAEHISSGVNARFVILLFGLTLDFILATVFYPLVLCAFLSRVQRTDKRTRLRCHSLSIASATTKPFFFFFFQHVTLPPV